MSEAAGAGVHPGATAPAPAHVARVPIIGDNPGVSRSVRYESPAVVVRVLPFGETSQVVHLATPDHGRVAALAKGSLRPGPEFQGGITLAAAGTAWLLRRPHAELELLRRFRPTEDLRGLRAELPRFYAACYVLDLLRAWMQPALPNGPLFGAAVTALRALARARSDALPTWVAWFEARALAATGHRPRLDACAVCDGRLGGREVFSAPAGGLVHSRCVPPGPRVPVGAAGRRGLERLYTARLAQIAEAPPGAEEVRGVRAVHDVFVPYVLERRPAAWEGRTPAR